MYLKHSLFIFSSFLCTHVSYTQDRKTIDQIFYEVSGPVKTMTELEEASFPESSHKDTTRTVYHFDEKGQLTKTEYYNHFDGDKPGPPTLGNITYFKKQEGNKRFYAKIQPDMKEPVAFFTLQKVNATTLKYTFGTLMSKDTLVKIFTLNKDNRFIKSVSSGKVYRFPATKQLEYFYNEKDKMKASTIRITDTETKETLEVSIQDDTYDQYGNMITGRYIDPNNKTVYRILRAYTYYPGR